MSYLGQILWSTFKVQLKRGRSGGQVVSVLAFYSDKPSSNPAEVNNCFVKLLLKGTKINKKRPELVDLNVHMTSAERYSKLIFVFLFWLK